MHYFHFFSFIQSFQQHIRPGCIASALHKIFIYLENFVIIINLRKSYRFLPLQLFRQLLSDHLLRLLFQLQFPAFRNYRISSSLNQTHQILVRLFEICCCFNPYTLGQFSIQLLYNLLSVILSVNSKSSGSAWFQLLPLPEVQIPLSVWDCNLV